MNEIVQKISQIALAIWLRRWLALAVAWPVAIVAAIGISFMSDRYEATAKVFVDTQTVLKPLMSGLAFQPDIDQQVQMLAKTLISRPNIEHLVDQPNIGYKKKDAYSRDREIERLMKDIKIAPATNNLYTVSYRDTNPQRASHVVQGLVDLFVDSGVGGKRRDSEEARRFIDDQIRTYEVKLTEAENRLKDFKMRNFGVVSGTNQDYFSRASALSDEIAKLRVDLSAAEHSRDALKRELANEDPQLPSDPGAANANPSETTLRLEAQKRQLDDLLRRFTDEHPDVVATRRSIAQLERQRQAELSTSRSGGRGAATSPVYQKIRISLAEAEAQVASLRTQLAVQQSRLDQIKATAGKVPETEAELAQMNRDYEVLRKNYEQLVSRRESAFLGVKLDQAAQLADFKMVEPTRVDPRAVMPNRQILSLASLLIAIMAGVGVAFGLSQLFPSFHMASDLREISGRPVLGSVSLFVSPAERLVRRSQNIKFFSIFGTMVLIHLCWVGWIITHSGF